MELNLVTKEDLEAFEKRIMAAIKSIDRKKEGLLNLDQACKYLGDMAPQTLRQKCCEGEIASHKAGGLKFTKEDLDAYIEKTRRKSIDELERYMKC